MKGAEFKVGDKVRIINNQTSSNNEVGDEGVIVELIFTPRGNYGYRVEVENRIKVGNWSAWDDIELIK